MTHLQCPICDNPKTWVIDIRQTKSGARRRYECPGCHKRFTTYETVVIKEDEALAQEIERKTLELQALLEKADKVKVDLMRLKLRQQDGKVTEVRPERPKGRPRREDALPLQQAMEPIVISSLGDFNKLSGAGKAEAFNQALERAKQRIEREKAANGIAAKV